MVLYSEKIKENSTCLKPHAGFSQALKVLEYTGLS